MADAQKETTNDSPPVDAQAAPLPAGLLGRWPWVTFILPLAVFMVFTQFEPTPGDTAEDSMLGLGYGSYPLVYTVKIAATVAAMLWVLPGYRSFSFRVTWLAPLVGVVGAVAWIGLAGLRLEEKILEPLGAASFLGLGQRSAYDPFAEIAGNPAAAWAFLAVRLFGLVLVVPVIEEFFLRGFVMRFLVDEQWWTVPIGRVNMSAVVAGTLVPMLMHPGELLAAAVWFSAVTWMMIRTRNIWDCVIAHAITNLLLGAYVLTASGLGREEAWQLM